MDDDTLAAAGGHVPMGPLTGRTIAIKDNLAGGSSTGSAALVAAGEVDMAIGGDQGGSVHIPSCWSGICGLKPTWGLVPYTGAFPIESSLDHLGPMARSSRDLTLLLSVLAGPDGLDPRQQSALQPVDYLAALRGDVAGCGWRPSARASTTRGCPSQTWTGRSCRPHPRCRPCRCSTLQRLRSPNLVASA